MCLEACYPRPMCEPLQYESQGHLFERPCVRQDEHLTGHTYFGMDYVGPVRVP